VNHHEAEFLVLHHRNALASVVRPLLERGVALEDVALVVYHPTHACFETTRLGLLNAAPDAVVPLGPDGFAYASPLAAFVGELPSMGFTTLVDKVRALPRADLHVFLFCDDERLMVLKFPIPAVIAIREPQPSQGSLRQDHPLELDDDMLLCPRCGDSMTHHVAVVVRSRPVQDGDGTTTTVTSNGVVTVEPTAAKDLPGRRDGLHVDFYCEQCDEDMVPRLTLVIEQHKGSSYLSLIINDDREPPR